MMTNTQLFNIAGIFLGPTTFCRAETIFFICVFCWCLLLFIYLLKVIDWRWWRRWCCQVVVIQKYFSPLQISPSLSLSLSLSRSLSLIHSLYYIHTVHNITYNSVEMTTSKNQRVVSAMTSSTSTLSTGCTIASHRYIILLTKAAGQQEIFEKSRVMAL